MFTIPGASPQSGITDTPLADAWASSFFCSNTISVFPPRSEKWQPASTAARAIGAL